MTRLVRLYPTAWRRRYEAEFLALLADHPPTLEERFDIVRGALDARLHPQVRGANEPPIASLVPEADLRLARRLGFAAVIGALLWPVAFGIVLMGPVVYDGAGAYRDGQAAFPVFYAAVFLLAGGLVGQILALPARARVARVAAGVAIPFLVLFGLGPWMAPLGLVALILVTTLAVAAWRSGFWSSLASSAVVGALLAIAAIVVFALNSGPFDRMTGGVFFLVGGLSLIPAWLSIGGTLLGRLTAVPAQRG
jgi:hypothetical protein